MKKFLTIIFTIKDSKSIAHVAIVHWWLHRWLQGRAHGYAIYLSVHNVVETIFERFSRCLQSTRAKFITTSQTQNSCNIVTRSGKSSTPVIFNESAIGQHLLDYLICDKITVMKILQFFIIWSFVFLFICLEAVYIKSCKLNLCRQEEFVYNLKLLR